MLCLKCHFMLISCPLSKSNIVFAIMWLHWISNWMLSMLYNVQNYTFNFRPLIWLPYWLNIILKCPDCALLLKYTHLSITRDLYTIQIPWLAYCLWSHFNYNQYLNMWHIYRLYMRNRHTNPCALSSESLMKVNKSLMQSARKLWEIFIPAEPRN